MVSPVLSNRELNTSVEVTPGYNIVYLPDKGRGLFQAVYIFEFTRSTINVVMPARAMARAIDDHRMNGLFLFISPKIIPMIADRVMPKAIPKMPCVTSPMSTMIPITFRILASMFFVL